MNEWKKISLFHIWMWIYFYLGKVFLVWVSTQSDSGEERPIKTKSQSTFFWFLVLALFLWSFIWITWIWVALILVLQRKLPPGRRPKEGQNLKPSITEWKKYQFVSYMNVIFFYLGKVLLCVFLPRKGKEAKKGPNKVRKEPK